jgi:NADH dehydrogenase/NADH:ubiquinone oxidoreductase subunit G
VGALTSKTYAFMGRAWENNSCETFDILNGFCSSIIVESRGVSIMRILPKYSREYSGWLPDRIRVIYDAFNYNKITTPYFKQSGSYVVASWQHSAAFVLISLIFLNYKNLVNLNIKFNIKFNIVAFKFKFIKLFRNFGFIYFNKTIFRSFLN